VQGLGQRALDLPTPTLGHAARKTLQLVGIRTVIVREVAVPAPIAARAVYPVRLQLPRKQDRDHILVFTRRQLFKAHGRH
jgi:hypothetical protein